MLTVEDSTHTIHHNHHDVPTNGTYKIPHDWDYDKVHIYYSNANNATHNAVKTIVAPTHQQFYHKPSQDHIKIDLHKDKTYDSHIHYESNHIDANISGTYCIGGSINFTWNY